MKRLFSVAIATTMLVASPALASTPTPKPAATVAPVHEEFSVQLRKVTVEKATTIYPGDKVTLVAVVKGTARTLRFDAYLGDTKLAWTRKYTNVSGEVSAKFVVPDGLASGNLRFEVSGTSAKGKEASDEDVFISAGPVTTTPITKPTAVPVPTPAPTPQPRHSDAMAMSTGERDRGPEATTPPTTKLELKGLQMPKFAVGVTHNSRPITSTAQSNNFTTSTVKLGFTNGMVASLKVLNAPEDANANPYGPTGYVTALGWHGAATKDVDIELMLGAHLPAPGASASNPLALGVSFNGNPGWEPLSHQLGAHTDLGALSLNYNNALRLAGPATGSLRLNAISGTSHKWDGKGGYWPQLWAGVELGGPLEILGADAALGLAYDIPMPTSAPNVRYGDGVRGWFRLSPF